MACVFRLNAIIIERTDQTELSYCLQIETDISINKFELSFIHATRKEESNQTSFPLPLLNSGDISAQDQGPALSGLLSSVRRAG